MNITRMEIDCCETKASEAAGSGDWTVYFLLVSGVVLVFPEQQQRLSKAACSFKDSGKW